MPNTLMVSVSGVRGIVGQGITPEVVLRFAQAFGTFMEPGSTVVVGSDTRVSRDMLKFAVLSGLISSGCHVVDVNICPTPTIQLAAQHPSVSGAIAITASHNPVDWNALKFIREDGVFLNQEQARKILALYDSQQFRRSQWDALGNVSLDATSIARHLELVLHHTDARSIRACRFRVALDCCNGAGGLITPHLLRELGCEVVEVNCEPNGLFAHNPEPVPANLVQLCEAVKSTGADIGFAHDADVDRLSIVTEQGQPLGEEFSLILATSFVLSRKRGPVVTNLSTTRAIDDVAAAHGCPVIRTKIGDVNVSDRMKEVGAVIGGEGNGGVIYPDLQYARDGVMAAALILQYLSSAGRPISALAGQMPQYRIVKRSRRFSREKLPQLLDLVRGELQPDEINEDDGLKLIWADRWIHVRCSGTEPIVRVIAEARGEEEAAILCSNALGLVDRVEGRPK